MLQYISSITDFFGEISWVVRAAGKVNEKGSSDRGEESLSGCWAANIGLLMAPTLGPGGKCTSSHYCFLLPQTMPTLKILAKTFFSNENQDLGTL